MRRGRGLLRHHGDGVYRIDPGQTGAGIDVAINYPSATCPWSGGAARTWTPADTSDFVRDRVTGFAALLRFYGFDEDPECVLRRMREREVRPGPTGAQELLATYGLRTHLVEDVHRQLRSTATVAQLSAVPSYFGAVIGQGEDGPATSETPPERREAGTFASLRSG